MVLPWDLTHNLKHADKHTGTSMSRHTDPSSLDTNCDTRFVPRTYAFAQRPKSDKNIPVNRSPKLPPRHFCINFKMFSLNQQGDLLSALPGSYMTKLEKGITWSVKAARTARAKWSCLGLTSHRRPILWKNWVKSKETIGNSWTVLKVILGHKYYHNH